MPPELDIVAVFPTGAGWHASAISIETDQVFTLLMNDPHEPVYLAKLVLPKALVAPHAPQVVWDRDDLVVLRSCLLKPEHEMVVPWLHARVERYASQPEDWGGSVAADPAPAPRQRTLTGPLSLKAEWQALVERHCEALTPSLTEALRGLRTRRWHPDVARLDIEVSHPYGVGGEAGLKLFTLGPDGWLVCHPQAGEDAPWSGSEALLPEVGAIVPEEALTQPRFAVLHQAIEDAYELAGKHLIDWVAACWQAAGDGPLPLTVTIGFADDEERLDLATGAWV
jgi:hypothetical protein